VVGVDLDAAMLDAARHKAPELHWVRADLLDVTVTDNTVTDTARRDAGPTGDVENAEASEPRLFDVVAMPGNVMIFVSPGTEAAVVANLARHLGPGGRLIAGFQLGPDRLSLDSYDAAGSAAGLELEDRWSTWDRAPFAGGDYAVSVHRAI